MYHIHTRLFMYGDYMWSCMYSGVVRFIWRQEGREWVITDINDYGDLLNFLLPWCLSDRASWIDYKLVTNLMHWLLFIHKILFSSICFEPQVLIFRRKVVGRASYDALPTSGVPRNFFRRGINKFSWGQRGRGCGGGSPLVRGSGGSCNLVQEISFHMVKFS